MNTLDPLVQALVAGDQHQALLELKRLTAAGVEREQIILEGVEMAMVQLDDRCTVEHFNLLEIMLAGRAVMSVMKEIYPPEAPPPHTRATVVLASLEGDVHDLGKNIVKMVLSARGYHIVDCGKDCPVQRLVETAEREGALAVGVSGLITSVIPQVRRVREHLAAQGLAHIKVLAGGAALKQATAASLNVDFVGQTAFECGHYLDQWVEQTL